MRLIIILSIIFLQPFFTIAQQPIVFNHLNVSNGLSQNSVLAIAQDSEGLMWFGTRYCLNKYDSKDFTIYKAKQGSKESISSNEFVQAIYTDRYKRLWIGTRKGLNLYQPRYDNYVQFFKKENGQGISDDYINCIYDDDYGNLWVGTQNGLSLLRNLKTGSFQSFVKTAAGNRSFEGYAVHTILQDSDRALWIGTDKGLFKLQQRGKDYFSLDKFTPSGKEGKTINDDFITTLAEDKNKKLWIGTRNGGLNCLDLETQTVRHFVHNASDKSSIVNNFIRKIIIDKNGKLWIGTQEGLSLFDAQTNTAVSYVHDPSNPGSLSQNSIYDICMDNQGSIWIGTYFGGINVVYNYATPFNIWQNNKYNSSLSSNIISSIIEDRNHNLWIGTEASGLNYYNKKTGLFSHYKNNLNDPGSLSSNLVKWIYEDHSGQIWVATHLSGLELFDPLSKSFKHYVHSNNKDALSSNNVSCLLEDSQHRFWVGTEQGLNQFDKKKGTFKVQDTHRSLSVNYLFEDSKQNIWAATNKGILKLAPQSSEFVHFGPTKDGQNSYLKANCIFEDRKGSIWFGIFHGGLMQYDPGSGKKRFYTEDDGLPSNNVLEILEEKEGLLWISSDKGLSRFDVKKIEFNNYNDHDGLPGTEFNNNSKLKDNTGKLYFGSYNGLVSFYPREINLNKLPPKIIFTDLRLFNKNVGIKDSTNILRESLNFSKILELKYDQNVFTISFAVLNYIKTEKNRFAYLLEGVDKGWNYTETGSAAYSGLPAGKYTLLVKGANNDGVWCLKPAKINIRILPPFWKTTWAYFIYMLLVGAILYYVIRFFRERAKLERDLYHEHLQYERQQELYQLKLNFFTNISHEIRTPLTLILGPIERLLSLTEGNTAVFTYVQNIKKNGDRLLRLVTELLDFRKIESGKMPLKVSVYNLVSFCEEIFYSFESLARSKNIDYRFVCEETSILLNIDGRQLEKVFYNILSNAFKFTHDEGQVVFNIVQHKASVEVIISDNGIGIAGGDLSKIFDDFYQVEHGKSDQGSGIGLALAKEIVALHQGNISVTSKVEKSNENGYTQFTVELPRVGSIAREDEQPTEDLMKSITMDDQMPENDGQPGKQTILIVEDNDEMREFISDSLKESYPLLTSNNGSAGLDCAIEQIPDLIISDVMMPVMDGLEFCKIIKSDERTSHIPVILLTARDAQVHHIEGLKTGADAYITKPFSPQILKLQIDNLMRMKAVLQKKYSHQLVLETSNVVIESFEEKFLNRIVKIITANIGNADFNISKLAAEIGMSQAVLYKKFSALTNMALADFIKSERLKQAAVLLKSGKHTVADIAYAVGYNDRKYFSKEFRKKYGLSPSQYLSKTIDAAP
ncbi:ligand-binding sensor domain-containing protein/signal transduction histidine kinase/CheY-like chemotaxis protein [Pedobacter sp. AK017]|uniref:hybrid sensor histidine kinase/response regulator transcription factor n=1 Tax=Pedobacter sp. AK017 TaxID=2723073 RepID=UPI0016169B96|nr:two-component regulator propeller domain-containing protein [Pedobacter sp. AK017]MBB5439663.1 ligand-binding sensor domain-containing protein/signal transduction histidine kinase/CheY-like chemotaxis protein [Pedobacter sp. AK017]